VNRVYEGKAGRREPACVSPAEESSLQELFLQGVEKVGMPTEITAESLIAVLRAGLDASHTFAQEMIGGRTERAELAKEALCVEVYGRCVLIEARRSFLRRAEDRANRRHMVSLRDELGL